MSRKRTEDAPAVATDADEEEKAEFPSPDTETTSARERRQPASIRVRSVVVGAIVVVLIGAVAVLGWLYYGAKAELDANAAQAANDRHAEEVALDYAVNAAAMDFKDLAAWKVRLVEGTSPELTEKLSKAADSMEQILVPLQWNSTAKPLVAKVRSHEGGIYVVDAFVSVLTKTVQAPEGLQSTATYSITLDGNNNWQITDVGGIDAVMPSN
jgi:Mce-associated membrane protein